MIDRLPPDVQARILDAVTFSDDIFRALVVFESLRHTAFSRMTTLVYNDDSMNRLSLPFPSSLHILTITGRTMTNILPSLPSSLHTLNCQWCKSLTSLPALPSSLHTLDCGRCESLTSLPALPSSLRTLDCEGCESLTSLPDLPSSLHTLNCDCDGIKITTESILDASKWTFCDR